MNRVMSPWSARRLISSPWMGMLLTLILAAPAGAQVTSTSGPGVTYVPGNASLTTGKQLIWQQLRQAYLASRFNNPHVLGTLSSPPTETNLAALPVGYVKYLLQTANPGNNTGIAHATGGDPVNASGGYKFQVASVLTGGNVSSTTNANAWRVKFVVDSAAPVFNVIQSGNPYRFIVNGQYVETTGVTAGNGGYGNWIQLTFSSRAIRNIWVESYQGQAVNAVGVLPNEAVYPAPAGLRMTVLGDSITAGTLTGSDTNEADGVFSVFCDALGIDDCRLSGVGGTGVQNNGGTQMNLQTRLSTTSNALAFTLDAPPSDVFVLAMGTNDTTFSVASNTSAYAGVIQQVLAQYPTTPIIVIGCPPGKPGPTEGTSALDLAIQAAVAQVNSQYVVFVPNASRLYPKAFGSGAVGLTTSGTVTATAAPSGVTSVTLTAGFPGPTGNYEIFFSGGTTKFPSITNNSTTLSWSGSVTDASATIQYKGLGGQLVMTGSLAAGATSATLNANFGGAGGFNSTAYIQFSDGEIRQSLLTNGSAAFSWTDALVGSATQYINWNDTTTYPGPNDVFYTTTSGAHPTANPGALAFGLDYADQVYSVIRNF
jgi:lysophospholipase L1-like esterase